LLFGGFLGVAGCEREYDWQYDGGFENGYFHDVLMVLGYLGFSKTRAGECLA
jgi:hypothetical protein